MMKFRDVELTPEQVRVAMECDTPEELMAVCKEINIDITKEEAEKTLENLEDIDLTSEEMKAIAGGWIRTSPRKKSIKPTKVTAC